MAKTKSNRAAMFATGMLAAVLCASLTACGGDMLATTEQAQGKASAPEAAAPEAAAGEAAPEAAANEVAVVFDTSNAAAFNDKFPESLGAFIVAFEPGDTAYDALDKTGIDFESRGRSYVSSIGGIAEKACGPNSGWLYLVDGVQPTKNASEFELSGGETVLWAYTVTEGDVAGSSALFDAAADAVSEEGQAA